jgi:hypothetical protein
MVEIEPILPMKQEEAISWETSQDHKILSKIVYCIAALSALRIVLYQMGRTQYP